MRVSAHSACSPGSKPRARVSAVCVDPVVETNGQGDESFGSIPRRAAGADGKYRPALAAARYRTHRAKRHAPLRGARKETGQFWRIREGSRAGSAVAISRRVTVRTVKPDDVRLDGDVRGDGMQGPRPVASGPSSVRESGAAARESSHFAVPECRQYLMRNAREQLEELVARQPLAALGSTTDHVVRAARCPVLTVHPPSGHA